VVDSHAGLAFLKEASDFHSRYITTVRNSSNIVLDTNQLVVVFFFLYMKQICTLQITI